MDIEALCPECGGRLRVILKPFVVRRGKRKQPVQNLYHSEWQKCPDCRRKLSVLAAVWVVVQAESS